MNIKGVFLLYTILQWVVLLIIVIVFTFVGGKNWMDEYKWIYLGLGVALACVFIIWTVISQFRIPLAVHIIFAVITNIAVSIFCGMATTCFEMKWCLTSLALTTVFAASIFLAAIFLKSFLLSNFNFLIACSVLMGIILILFIVFSVIQFHLKVCVFFETRIISPENVSYLEGSYSPFH
ncbi:unnamed protein product [Trichobilharzia szidati]|nr:unnamed protein product [Trichobilharzia szidati]